MNTTRNNNSGFTLAETLLATLLITIVFTSIAGAAHLIKGGYRKTIEKSEADVLLTTGNYEIQRDLQTSINDRALHNSDWLFDAKAKDLFYSLSSGCLLKYENATEGKKGIQRVLYKDFYLYPHQTPTKEPLLPEKAQTENMYLKIEDLTYDEQKQCYTYTLKVLSEDGTRELAKQEYVVHAVNALKKGE